MSQNAFPSPRQARTLARGLGWFSIGLGLVELVAARRVSRAVGLPGHTALIAAFGVREVINGLGLLRSRQPGPWLWGRVAGDAVDAAALATAFQARGDRTGTAVALGAVAGISVLDVTCARALSAGPARPPVDYSARSGWPLPAVEMRGAARNDFTPPRDMRIPQALRPWPQQAAG